MERLEITEQTPPHLIFDSWIKEAAAHPATKDATAMTVATVSPEGEPYARVVLCKEWSVEGFTFFTNYNSTKGRHLAHTPRAAAVFYWEALFRQVIISGQVEKVPRQVSVDYWRTRPRESQISQCISRQSETAASRQALEEAWAEAENRFRGAEVPCPEHWGGYILKPRRMEFWIGRPGRLHDRFEFVRSGASPSTLPMPSGPGVPNWTFRRLYP